MMESPVLEKGKPSPLSCLVLFLVRKKELRVLIPDYEVFMCKKKFLNGKGHENFFGLGRLLAFEGKFHEAAEMLESALKIVNDDVYLMWKSVLKVKLKNTLGADKLEIGKNRVFRCFCYEAGEKTEDLLGKIMDLPESLEKYWCLFELASKSLSQSEPPEYFAGKIKALSEYYGYLAWSQIFLQKNDYENAIPLLKELILSNGSHPESYISLWHCYYFSQKDFGMAEDLACEAVLKISTIDYPQYYILFCIFSAKSKFRLKQVKECLDFLQRKFIENPTYPVLLYYYGLFCTKSEDFIFNGSAIGVLEECVRLCDESRYGNIFFWLARAYMMGRQYLDAYESIKLAIFHLSNSHAKKVSILKKWLCDIEPSVLKIKTIEELLLKDLDSERYNACKALCKEVKPLHRLTIAIITAKMLWKSGKREKALKKLYSVSGISTVKMTGYFLLLKYLEAQNEYKCMKTVASEMVMKCKNPQVPSHVWVKVNLLYAKILVKNNKPGKAILVLKCLAKLLPPIPFTDISYTKILQRAKTIQDLTSINIEVLETMNTYNYSGYKNSFITTSYNAREFSQKLIAEEAAPLPNCAIKAYNCRKAQRTVTERLFTPKRYEKKRTLEANAEEEIKELTILGVSIPNLLDFRGFSICSDPKFLYKIGKISAEFRIFFQDGLCAITDFIELLKFEKDLFVQEKFQEKARKVKAELVRLSNLN